MVVVSCDGILGFAQQVHRRPVISDKGRFLPVLPAPNRCCAKDCSHDGIHKTLCQLDSRITYRVILKDEMVQQNRYIGPNVLSYP